MNVKSLAAPVRCWQFARALAYATAADVAHQSDWPGRSTRYYAA